MTRSSTALHWCCTDPLSKSLNPDTAQPYRAASRKNHQTSLSFVFLAGTHRMTVFLEDGMFNEGSIYIIRVLFFFLFSWSAFWFALSFFLSHFLPSSFGLAWCPTLIHALLHG